MITSWLPVKSCASDHFLKRALLVVIAGLGVFHLLSLGQVPPVGVLEGWYVDPAFYYYKFGRFDYTMFPGLVEFQNGSFGQGNLRFWLQSCFFKFLGFGLFQTRLPMLLGGLLTVYFIYLTGRRLFGGSSGLFSALLFIAAPVFYNAHMGDAHSWLAASFILSSYFFLRLLSEKRAIFAFWAGFTIGISVSFHIAGSLGVVPLTFLVFYHRFKKELSTSHALCYLAGGVISFVIWYSLTVSPIGLDAFIQKSSYGVQVSESGYIGNRWINYFLKSGRGVVVELPLLVVALGSYGLFSQESQTRFFYLFFVGLFIVYSLFVGSASSIAVWAALFLLIGGLTHKILSRSIPIRPLLSRVWIALLALVLLYYFSVQGKRAYEAFWKRPGDHYAELNARMATHISPGKMIMGAPLYWFGFIQRNPYITQNFYWERMDKQTHELGVSEQQPDSIRTQRMIAFLKRRNVEYLIADEYFQQALKPWIPEDRWRSIFKVEAEFQSPIYGAPSGGGRLPYRIQVWRMKEDIVL